MHTFAAPNTSLAGLGFSFDSITIQSSFSSGEENFHNLFADPDSASPATSHNEPGSGPSTRGDSSSVGDDFSVSSDEEPERVHYQPSAGDAELGVTDFPPWPR